MGFLDENAAGAEEAPENRRCASSIGENTDTEYRALRVAG
jgi:hypothetical protein